MATFLFDKIVFGPVKSRRLGISLGINLLPVNRKICNFNCIYCECGLTHGSDPGKENIPSREEVYKALESKLLSMKNKGEEPDVITYAGNGEPTLHPEFPGIIDDSILLRDKYFPAAKVAVLSNSTAIAKPHIKEVLLKVDQNILKLDSAFDLTMHIHNRPGVNIKVDDLIRELQSYNGHLIIQTLFLRGTFKGKNIDNTTDREIKAWLEALKKIRPSQVMIYTISRDTPEGGELSKVPLEELRHIASLVNQLGIETQVSG